MISPHPLTVPQNQKRSNYYRPGFLLLLIAIGAIAIILGSSYLGRKHITIDVNGSMQEIRTDASTVGDALDEADVYLDQADWVEPAIDTPIRSDMTILVTRASQLALEIDGEVRRVYTHAVDPLVILVEQAVHLNPGDQLYVDYQLVDIYTLPQFTLPPQHLRVITAHPFVLYDNSQLVADGKTTAATVGALLDEYAVTLYLADAITPPIDAPITNGLEVSIIRSVPVTILVDERMIDTRATGPTVIDTINQVGLVLTGQDYTRPNEQTFLEANMTIEIIRVVEAIEVEQEIIEFQTLTLPDPDLPYGEQHTIQEGQTGLREIRVRIRRENNRIVSRIVQENWVIASPVPEIKVYGTGSSPDD